MLTHGFDLPRMLLLAPVILFSLSFHEFAHAYKRSSVNIAVIIRDNFEIEFRVGRVRIVAAGIPEGSGPLAALYSGAKS